MNYLKRYKFLAAIILLVIAVASYFGYQRFFGTGSATHYALAQAQKGTLILSVSGNGQVSASDQIDIKPKVSGDVADVYVKNGQEVRTGTLLVRLNSKDAQKLVRDAEANLESAKLQLEKINLQHSQLLRADNLSKSYEEGLGTLAKLYDSFSAVLNNFDKIFFGQDISGIKRENNIEYYASYNQKEFTLAPLSARTLFNEINDIYKQSLTDYQAAQRANGKERELALQSGYQLTVKTSELVKLGRDAVRSLQNKLIKENIIHNKEAVIDEHSAYLANYADSLDTYLTGLLSVINAISSQQDALDEYPLDRKSQELVISQRENSLRDAKEKLDDYSVLAPFDGVISQFDLVKGDAVSAATVLGILITKQKIAEISLNEVDAIRIKSGQKATLAFDAIPDFSLAGQVIEVDAVGTLSQGVVTYNVKIAFEVQDERIKPPMSVSALIVTEARPGALLVPSSAVKLQREISYVEMPGKNDSVLVTAGAAGIILKETLRRQVVQAGLSNDEFTEIVSGLNEGDLVVTRTIQSNSQQQTQTTQSSSGFRIPGFNTGSGGMRVR